MSVAVLADQASAGSARGSIFPPMSGSSVRRCAAQTASAADPR